MIYDPNKHHRRSIRLKGFDYTRERVFRDDLHPKSGVSVRRNCERTDADERCRTGGANDVEGNSHPFSPCGNRCLGCHAQSCTRYYHHRRGEACLARFAMR